MPSPFRRKNCRPFPKHRAHINQGRTRIARDAEAAPTRGKICRKSNAAFFARKTCRPFPKHRAHFHQGRTRLRVMPKPLRLAGKHVAGAMRLSLLGKHVAFFPKHRAHINQGRTRIARDAEAAPTRGKICRKSNAAFFARKTCRLFSKTSRAHQSGAHAHRA